jgi:hypothetical protein
MLPDMEFFTAFLSTIVFKDFLTREGIMLVVIVGGYMLAHRYNRFLDDIEKEISIEERKKRKEEKL